MVRRAFRGGRAIVAERNMPPAETTTTTTTETSEAPARPEATRTRVTRNVRHVVDAAYPSINKTLHGEVLGAGAEAAQDRPEGDTRRARASRYVRAAAAAAGRVTTGEPGGGTATAVVDPPATAEPQATTAKPRPRPRPRPRKPAEPKTED